MAPLFRPMTPFSKGHAQMARLHSRRSRKRLPEISDSTPPGSAGSVGRSLRSRAAPRMAQAAWFFLFFSGLLYEIQVTGRFKGLLYELVQGNLREFNV